MSKEKAAFIHPVILNSLNNCLQGSYYEFPAWLSTPLKFKDVPRSVPAVPAVPREVPNPVPGVPDVPGVPGVPREMPVPVPTPWNDN